MKDLVENNLKLVWSIVRRFAGRGIELEDLYQTGCVGLIKAADRFDPTLGLQFSTYAVPLITGEIMQVFRDSGIIKVSRSLKVKGYKIKSFQEKYIKDNGKTPTISAISDALNMEREEVVEAMGACNSVVSLNEAAVAGNNGKNSDSDGRTLMDTLVAEGWGSEEVMFNKVVINEALAKLEGEERKLMILRFVCGKTQQQVAEELGVSQVKISRMEKKIREQLNVCL